MVSSVYVDYIVNKTSALPSLPTPLPTAARTVRVYLVVVVATLASLTILSFVAPHQATSKAWGHAIVVSVFAVVLPLRLRSAQAGRRSAIRAVGLIAAVLFLVNVIEALVPGFVPVWMRAQMGVVAVLMMVIVLDVVRWAVTSGQR